MSEVRKPQGAGDIRAAAGAGLGRVPLGQPNSDLDIRSKFSNDQITTVDVEAVAKGSTECSATVPRYIELNSR